MVRVRLEYPMTAFRRSTGAAGGGRFIDREEPFEPMWPDERLKSGAATRERNKEREGERGITTFAGTNAILKAIRGKEDGRLKW